MNTYSREFGTLALLLASLIFAQIACAEPLPNAWQITHATTASSSALYYTNQLTAAQRIASTNNGFRFTVNARFVNDYNDDETMTMIYGLGNTKRFLIWWDLNSSNDLTARLEGGPTYILTTNGTGTALYHTHEILFTNGAASYVFDGVVKTNNWTGSANIWPAGTITWGAGSSSSKGQMNFHSVTFQVTNGIVASYDAGTAGNPVTAPNPTNYNWTLFPSLLATDTAVTNISPDTTLLPVATTLAADQLTSDGARLNGQVNPRGSPALAWFEWGTSTNYGNVTAPQPVGGGITPAGFSNSISGLIVGTNYYFCAVVSNSFGAVAGSSQTFNLAVFLPSATTSNADQLNTTNARLHGPANPNGSPAMAWFEWGTDTNYGNATSPQNLGSGSASVAVSDVLTNLAGGPVYHFRLVATNTFGLAAGSDQSFSLSLLLTDIPGLPGVYHSSVAWGDYDHDGRLDFLLTGLTNINSSGAISQLWRNTGVGFSNVTASVAPGLPGVYYSSVAWGDYDNDGRLDFLLTGYFYNGTDNYVSQLWRNNLPFSNAPPAAPTGLSATTTGTTVSLNWNSAADDLTPGAGLDYNLRIGSTPGAADVLAPMAFTNGLRLLPELGNAQTGTNALFNASGLAPGHTYYWSVQALDTSFAGSPFATEQEFYTPPLLINPVRFSSGLFEFNFTNQTALNFDVLVSTNVALPVSSWLNLGPALDLGGDHYRFTDSGAIGQGQRFYRLRQQ